MRSKLASRLAALETAANVAAMQAAPPLALVLEADGTVHDLEGQEYSAERLRTYRSSAPSLVVNFVNDNFEPGSLANIPPPSKWEPAKPKPERKKNQRRNRK